MGNEKSDEAIDLNGGVGVQIRITKSENGNPIFKEVGGRWYGGIPT
jgi:hypothetical protein